MGNQVVIEDKREGNLDDGWTEYKDIPRDSLFCTKEYPNYVFLKGYDSDSRLIIGHPATSNHWTHQASSPCRPLPHLRLRMILEER